MTSHTKVVLDAEFNGLQPTKIWCVVSLCTDTGNVKVFKRGDPTFRDDVLEYLSNVKEIIGHKINTYDLPWLRVLLEADLDHMVQHDTLVISRLINAGIFGGHSVENLGKIYKAPVNKVSVGRDEWDDEDKLDLYVERCVADVKIQHFLWCRAFKRFAYDEEWQRALDLEYWFDYQCQEMHENGFPFDYDKSTELLSRIEDDMAELEERILEDAPLFTKQTGQPITLRRTKDGRPTVSTDRNVGDASFRDGVQFWRVDYEPFNPGSTKHRIKYLNMCGWKPTEKTKGHIKQERVVSAIRRKLRNANIPQTRKKFEEELEKHEAKLAQYRETGWRVTETNLSTLPKDAPESAHLLAAWLQLEGKRADLVEWRAAFVQHTRRIHGSIRHIGAWTGRVSHSNPNVGNIFSTFNAGDIRGDSPSPVELVKLRYNNDLRALWGPQQGGWQVGSDASGIQLRLLAHYMEDEDYIKAVCEGNSNEGTDVHSLNCKLLGEVCASRSVAKTFIYAFLLGAGDAQVASILDTSHGEARRAVGIFLERLPALAQLKHNRCAKDAARGFFVGLDGRKVIVPSQHHVLAGYLQNGEAVVMKTANRIWTEKATVPYRQLDYVHDEFQTEVNSEEDAHVIGKLQVESIREAGIKLGLRCPLDGEYKVGHNWLDCH